MMNEYVSEIFRDFDIKEYSETNEELQSSKATNWIKRRNFPRLLIKEQTSKGSSLNPYILQPSLFHRNHVPPTLYFNSKFTSESRSPVCLPKSVQKLLKWRFSAITPNSIRSCVMFTRLDLVKDDDIDPVGQWCRHMLIAEFSTLQKWKKVNHFPGSYNLGRKDNLWTRLKLAQSKFRFDDFNFHPRTFILPKDYKDLQEFWNQSDNKLFIMKPPASSRGNGIKVINDISQIPETAINVLPNDRKKSKMIVQQYISNPCLLENGHKFDLRIYVLLTSIEPLRLYVYPEGLVRFASSKYSNQDDGIIDQYMHLTNYFINKNNRDYRANHDCNSLNGSKWTLSSFFAYLEKQYSHVDTQKLWSQIIDIIIKTFICCEGPISRSSRLWCKNDYNTYELFGFDIILDENFKPWILEVNITPSLKSDSNLDSEVKYRVIKDMFNLVGFNIPPSLASLAESIDSPIYFDERFYTEKLTKHDHAKHQKFQINSAYPKLNSFDSNNQNADDVNRTICLGPIILMSDVTRPPHPDSILNDLTENDLRVLMLSEDEFSRKGDFIRVIPTANSNRYLRYLDKPKYYNLLLDAWERKYHNNRHEGLELLSRQATFMDH